MATQEGCDPCGVMSEQDITGNSGTIIENIYGAIRDGVTSGVATLKTLFGSGPMKEASFDYSSGQRTLNYSPLTSTLDKAKATGNALLGIAGAIPVDGPAVGLLTKTPGITNSVAAVIKDASTVDHGVIAGGDALRIQKAANKIDKPITVVGSRASGTAKAGSDWDYVIPGLKNSEWKKIKNSLPLHSLCHASCHWRAFSKYVSSCLAVNSSLAIISGS